jgi:hypothetical protein
VFTWYWSKVMWGFGKRTYGVMRLYGAIRCCALIVAANSGCIWGKLLFYTHLLSLRAPVMISEADAVFSLTRRKRVLSVSTPSFSALNESCNPSCNRAEKDQAAKGSNGHVFPHVLGAS